MNKLIPTTALFMGIANTSNAMLDVETKFKGSVNETQKGINNTDVYINRFNSMSSKAKEDVLTIFNTASPKKQSEYLTNMGIPAANQQSFVKEFSKRALAKEKSATIAIPNTTKTTVRNKKAPKIVAFTESAKEIKDDQAAPAINNNASQRNPNLSIATNTIKGYKNTGQGTTKQPNLLHMFQAMSDEDKAQLMGQLGGLFNNVPSSGPVQKATNFIAKTLSKNTANTVKKAMGNQAASELAQNNDANDASLALARSSARKSLINVGSPTKTKVKTTLAQDAKILSAKKEGAKVLAIEYNLEYSKQKYKKAKQQLADASSDKDKAFWQEKIQREEKRLVGLISRYVKHYNKQKNMLNGVSPEIAEMMLSQSKFVANMIKFNYSETGDLAKKLAAYTVIGGAALTTVAVVTVFCPIALPFTMLLNFIDPDVMHKIGQFAAPTVTLLRNGYGLIKNSYKNEDKDAQDESSITINNCFARHERRALANKAWKDCKDTIQQNSNITMAQAINEYFVVSEYQEKYVNNSQLSVVR